MLYADEAFDEPMVRAIFTKLRNHHDALRITFRRQDDEWTQYNHAPDEASLSVVVYDVRQDEDIYQSFEEKVNRVQRSINIVTGPIMQVAIIHVPEGCCLLIVINHLIMDGISWRILYEDFGTLYEQYKKGESLSLPDKTTSFKEWSERLTAHANSAAFLAEKAYWQSVLPARVAPLPKDFAIDRNCLQDRVEVSLYLTPAETETLLTRVNETFGTEINDVLLAGLCLAVQRVYGYHALLLTLEGHGREEILADVDITRTLGWFTSAYPVLLPIPGGDDLKQQVAAVKQYLRAIPHKGVGYSLLRHLTRAEHKQDVDFALHPEISFNYMGQFKEDIRNTGHRIARASVGQTMSGDTESVYVLDVSGVVHENQLSMTLAYNRNQYRPATIDTLWTAYGDALREMVAYARHEAVPAAAVGL
jgi:non-ribosomal peptide synthase protein (TIGR01720 family)